MEKPKLVDYNLFQIKKPIVKKITSPNEYNLNSYINILGILIIVILCLFMYNRFKNKDIIQLEKQNSIIHFHQYVKEKLEK